jgi:hypothetical protein
LHFRVTDNWLRAHYIYASDYIYKEINITSAYLVELFKLKLALPDGTEASFITPPPGITVS